MQEYLKIVMRVSSVLVAGMLLFVHLGCKGGREPPIETVYPLTGQLNDTGGLLCSSENQIQQVCPQSNLPGQDAEFGRDAKTANLKKQGSGVAGFDWVKLNAAGQPLTQQNVSWSDDGSETVGSHWSCVQDYVTGLIWEIKEKNPAHPRYFGHTYSWWMDSEQLNGGFKIHFTPGICSGISLCEAQAYIDWVNQQGLCGHKDWRLPSIRELVSISVISNEIPALDRAYFPDTIKPRFFTNQTYAGDPSRAWYVYFSDGSVSSTGKSDASFLRLVRGAN
jgi:Protein of unknown function (DUF1566)